MKKLNKLFAILVAMAMVLSLTVISAFAEDTNPTTGKKAYFSKILNIANGLTAPDVDFEFTATPLTVDGIDYDATAANMPTFTAQTINFKTKTTGTDGNIVTTKYFDFDVTFPHAGVYVYEINETPGNADGVTYNTGSDKYTITVTVKDVNGTPTVDRVVVQDKDGKKVDADEPTEKDPSANGSEDDNMSKMKFSNNYTKTADQTDTKDGKDASLKSSNSLSLSLILRPQLMLRKQLSNSINTILLLKAIRPLMLLLRSPMEPSLLALQTAMNSMFRTLLSVRLIP